MELTVILWENQRERSKAIPLLGNQAGWSVCNMLWGLGV